MGYPLLEVVVPFFAVRVRPWGQGRSLRRRDRTRSSAQHLLQYGPLQPKLSPLHTGSGIVSLMIFSSTVLLVTPNTGARIQPREKPGVTLYLEPITTGAILTISTLNSIYCPK